MSEATGNEIQLQPETEGIWYWPPNGAQRAICLRCEHIQLGVDQNRLWRAVHTGRLIFRWDREGRDGKARPSHRDNPADGIYAHFYQLIGLYRALVYGRDGYLDTHFPEHHRISDLMAQAHMSLLTGGNRAEKLSAITSLLSAIYSLLSGATGPQREEIRDHAEDIIKDANAYLQLGDEAIANALSYVDTCTEAAHKRAMVKYGFVLRMREEVWRVILGCETRLKEIDALLQSAAFFLTEARFPECAEKLDRVASTLDHLRFEPYRSTADHLRHDLRHAVTGLCRNQPMVVAKRIDTMLQSLKLKRVQLELGLVILSLKRPIDNRELWTEEMCDSMLTKLGALYDHVGGVDSTGFREDPRSALMEHLMEAIVELRRTRGSADLKLIKEQLKKAELLL